MPINHHSSIKIGTLTQKPSQVVSNIVTAIPAIATRLPGGWDNIQNFFIKTNTSVSLPIWSCSLDERWTGLKEDKGKEGVKGKAEGKSKKRPAVENSDGGEDDEEGEGSEDDDEVQAQPRKKAKSDTGKTTTTPIPPTTKPKKTTHQSTDQQPKPKKPATSTSTSETHQRPTKLAQKSQSRTQAPVTTQATKPKTHELTKDEMKQKRSVGLVEKKKEKIVNKKKPGLGVNGKSVKAKMLGKKALLT